MRVLLTTLGSHGDVHPFMAMARALAARGHEPALLINPAFESQAGDEGIPLYPLGDRVDLKELIAGSRAMDPMVGPMVVFRRLLLPHVPLIIQRMRETIREFRPDVIVSHSICLGVPWVAREAGIPLAIAGLAPIAWMNPGSRPVLRPTSSAEPAGWTVRLNLAVARGLLRVLLDPALNRVRREMGLPKQKNIYLSHTLGGDVNLGLWSPRFCPPIEGDPPTGRICGFPWFDRHAANEADAGEVEGFMGDGEPPIVFSLGTAAVHASGRFYEHAAQACRLLGRRGVLLVGRTEYAPRGLPPTVRAFTYAPFSTVLPRAAATVHHAGIGTTAQTLRSGRPSLACPLAHDQFDNGARLVRLGVGGMLPHARATAPRLCEALRGILEDDGVCRRAASLGEMVAAEDGAARAVEHLEALHANGESPRSGVEYNAGLVR
ncbi:MAG: glycosyltransferase [Phycisphaeraceae bacterium]|nr:glycosyltransferase [Phycisphaeraceae bacterium]